MSDEDLPVFRHGGPAEHREVTDARSLRALAHPVRAALLEALVESARCPGDGAGVAGYGDGMGCMGSPTAA